MSKRIKLIANPVAGNHAVAKQWPEVRKRAERTIGQLEWEFTRGAGHATTITRQALAEGFETVVALGGDGTINEVVNGFFEDARLIRPEANLAVIPMGTGGDWVKTLMVGDTWEEAVEHIANGSSKQCDLGLLRCRSPEGDPISRYFLNVADAGFGGTLVQFVNGTTKAFGSFFAYLIGLLRTLSIYKNTAMQIAVDDAFAEERVVSSVTVANGQFFGGGMWIAPEARIDDGLFEVIVVGDVTRREVLANIHKLYNGTLATHKKVTCLRGKHVTLNCEHQVFLEADGELAGKLPVSFEVIPGALKVIC
ncbi:MAG: diacylglycerol/lipid kinase family protein [bacterium]